jgi:hypothetical protein
MDVVLLLDGSGSITKPTFDDDVLAFARRFARFLKVSADGNHLGIVQFSHHFRQELPLDRYTDPVAVWNTYFLLLANQKIGILVFRI